MLLSDWLLCARGVSAGQVVDVGVAVGMGVTLGAGLEDETGISLLGLTWNRPTVTIDFFSSDIGESLDLVTLAATSDTTRDTGRLGEDLRLEEDTVFCGLWDADDTGELVLDVLVLAMLGVLCALEEELSARSLSCPVIPH